jgi:hypothetical protein
MTVLRKTDGIVHLYQNQSALAAGAILCRNTE